MSLDEAQKAMRDAAADLNALRDQAKIALSNFNTSTGVRKPSPVVDAWEIAVKRFEAACKEYAEAGK